MKGDDSTRKVNVYIATSIQGPRRRNGAIGYLLEYITDKGPVTLTKFEQINNATANQAELIAMIKALKRLKEKCELQIYTESEYLAAGYTQKWVDKWINSNWKNAKGEQVKNSEEWQQIQYLLNGHEFQFMVRKNHQYREWLKNEVKKESEKYV